MGTTTGWVARSRETRPRRIRSTSVLLTLMLLMGTTLSVVITSVAPTTATALTPCPCSLWSTSTTPANVDSGDANAVELGVQFSSATSGYISGVRFYKASTNTGIHVGSLWTSDGTLLAQATFSDESGSGWQQVSFSQPVAVTANTAYVAGYHTNTGHYSFDQGYFTSGAYTNDPLTAPGNDTNPNGLFAYSASPTFPTGTFNGDNYWVDVVYSPTAPPPPAAASSLWGPDTTPTVIDSGDANAVELGMQFRSTTNGSISGVRFYKASTNTGTHIGSLWAADGTLLAQATFSSESGSGWQQVSFSQPVAVTANTTYVAGYHTDTGHYSFDQGYFTNSGYLNTPLSAPGGTPSNPNGLYAYSPTPTFPTGTFNGDNYWVDVMFAPAPIPVGVAVSAPLTQLPKGLTEQLSATESFSDGTTRNVTSSVTWTSSNPATVTVSASGLVGAIAAGPATVTASIDGLSGATTVAVVAPVAFVLVNPPVVLIWSGQTRQLGVIAILTNGRVVNLSSLATWGPPRPTGAATVSPTGLLSGSRPGLTIVSASIGRWTALGLVLSIR